MKTIDIIERSQTRHALEEEREIENLQILNHAALASEDSEESGKLISDQKFQKKSKGKSKHEN